MPVELFEIAEERDVEVEVEEAAPLVLLVDPEDEVLGFASALATLVAELASCGLLVTTC